MATSQAKIDALARAREAKRLKKLAEANGSPEDALIAELEDENYDRGVWLSALITAMKTREVKTVNDVNPCVPIADEVLRIYKAKFE